MNEVGLHLYGEHNKNAEDDIAHCPHQPHPSAAPLWSFRANSFLPAFTSHYIFVIVFRIWLVYFLSQWLFYRIIYKVTYGFLTLSRLWGGAESARAEFKCRYLNNGYCYDSNISRRFLEIQCQYGQKECWKNIG